MINATPVRPLNPGSPDGVVTAPRTQGASSTSAPTGATTGGSKPPSLKKKFPLKWVIGGLFLLLLLVGGIAGLYLTQVNQDVRQQAYNDDVQKPGGAGCTDNKQCASGKCVNKTCEEPAVTPGAPNGSACKTAKDCKSGICEKDKCMASSDIVPQPDGSACKTAKDCKSGVCENSKCMASSGSITCYGPAPTCSVKTYAGLTSCPSGSKTTQEAACSKPSITCYGPAPTCTVKTYDGLTSCPSGSSTTKDSKCSGIGGGSSITCYGPAPTCSVKTYEGLTACPSGSKTTQDPTCKDECRVNSECKSGYVCSNGSCTMNPLVCKSNSDCKSGYVCSSGSCKMDPLACKYQSDCKSGYVCSNGSCTMNPLVCKSNSDCKATYICSKGSCIMNPLSCKSNTDCKSGVCTNGACSDGSGLGGGLSTPPPTGTQCTGNNCSAPTGGCIAVHSCDQLDSNGHCTVTSPRVTTSSVDAQAEANRLCKCVQVDVLNGNNNSCTNGHCNATSCDGTLIDHRQVCPNTSCQTTTNPSNPPGDNDDDDDEPSYSCNSSCSTDAQCQTDHSSLRCVTTQNGQKCRLGTNPSATNCQPAVGPACRSITMSTANGTPIALGENDPKKGDTIKFTCGAADGADHYIFRIVEPDQTRISLQATGAVSEAYTITKAGQFFAQCQICTGASDDTCHAFEGLE